MFVVFLTYSDEKIIESGIHLLGLYFFGICMKMFQESFKITVV